MKMNKARNLSHNKSFPMILAIECEDGALFLFGDPSSKVGSLLGADGLMMISISVSVAVVIFEFRNDVRRLE